VTDSAAASSAWGSGHRVNNRTINILPDGTILEPIARRFRQAGKKVGVVTTATVTHATPAGFVANVESRRSEDEIARQYLDRIDLALGGGAKFFDPATREDRADLFADYQKAGFAVARSAGELAQVAQPGARVLGVFAPDHLPYSIDQRNDKNLESSVPSLADMTKAALNCLAGQGEGFLLQVEGARIDHAAHHNDIATLLWEQLAFDDAVQVSLDFARENGDTLVIVTTDHGNSNPGLNGMGPDYTDSTRCFERIGQARESFFALEQWACKQLADGRLTAPRWAEMMQQATGLEPTPAEADILFAAVAGASEGSLNKQLANFWGLMGQITGNHTGVGWCGTTHTADPAILHARGPGASAFHGWVQNFEVCGRLCALAGVVSPSAPA
jgi:alkaline phosphatase